MPNYFWPRPSAAGNGYDAANSSGSNLGPTSKKLMDRISGTVAALEAAAWRPIPGDAATASGSGLDPDISLDYARAQVARIAAARSLPAEQVEALVSAETEGPMLGVLGETRRERAEAQSGARRLARRKGADGEGRISIADQSPTDCWPSGRRAKGKLTVFLGAAPGVGKTFAMLSRAARLKPAGTDVVVGLVETHGRSRNRGADRGARDPAAPQGRLSRPRARGVRPRRRARAQARSHHRRRDWRTPTRRAAGIPSAIRTSTSCSRPGSTSGRRSTSSTSKASPISWRGSPASKCARPCPTSCCENADEVMLVDLPPAELIERLQGGQGLSARERAARASKGSSSRPTSRRCANWRCAAPPTASTTRWSTCCARARSRARGRRPSGCWSGRPRRAVGEGRAHREPAGSGLNAPWLVRVIARQSPSAEPSDATAARRDVAARRAARRRDPRGSPADDFVAEILKIARRENITQIVVGRPQAVVAGAADPAVAARRAAAPLARHQRARRVGDRAPSRRSPA